MQFIAAKWSGELTYLFSLKNWALNNDFIHTVGFNFENIFFFNKFEPTCKENWTTHLIFNIRWKDQTPDVINLNKNLKFFFQRFPQEIYDFLFIRVGSWFYQQHFFDLIFICPVLFLEQNISVKFVWINMKEVNHKVVLLWYENKRINR